MDQKETTTEIKGFLYEESKMQKVLDILNTIPISGTFNIKNMGLVFDILANPIQFESVENNDSKTQ